MLQLSHLKVTALNSAVRIAIHVQLEVTSQDSILPNEKLEQIFLNQFEGHTVCQQALLVAKHMGKKLLLSVKEIKSKESNSLEAQLADGLSSLSMESSSTARGYFTVLSSTRISFTAESVATAPTDSFELEDFGGSEEVVREIKKLCASVFRRGTPSKSSFPLLLPVFLPASDVIAGNPCRSMSARRITVRSSGDGQVAPGPRNGEPLQSCLGYHPRARAV